MNITRRTRNVASAAAIAASLGLALCQPSIDAPKVCHAETIIFEDGTWVGGQIFDAEGAKLADRWDVTGPELQNTVTDGVFHSNFPVSVNGSECEPLS